MVKQYTCWALFGLLLLGMTCTVQAQMRLIKGGTFQMGTSDFPDAQPLREVQLNDFWIDEHEVTNAEFARFVEATAYVTVAERPLDPADYPGVDPALLVPGSAVFVAPEQVQGLANPLQWWQYRAGANWKHPEGLGSSWKGREQHPVVHVAYEDAAAYAKWAGKRLPTEAEWEYASKGDSLIQDGCCPANIFQGEFPVHNSLEDGFAGTAPVKSFAANAHGLYDMAGNVWEWCADYYRPNYNSSDTINPKGPAASYDPNEPGAVKRVQRGGSFLCSDGYCERYKSGARGKGEQSSTSNHVGFRCVKDVEDGALINIVNQNARVE